MTRGNFVGIHNGTVYISPQFNGDMYPSGNGKLVYFLLSYVVSVNDLKEAVKYFDNHVFGYFDDNKASMLNKQDTSLDFSSNYIKKYHSDYLYIKNLGLSSEKITDSNGTIVEIMPGEIQVWYFGKLVTVEDEVLTLNKNDINLLNMHMKPVVLVDDSITEKAQVLVSAIINSLKEKVLKKCENLEKNASENFIFLNDVFFANTGYFLVYNDITFYWDGDTSNMFRVHTNEDITEPILLDMYEACVDSITKC